MLEKLKNMTYAEVKKIRLPDGVYLCYFDAWKHLSAGFDDDNPEIFHGISNGKRNTEVQASLYDAMMAEIMDERNAEKRRHEKHRAGKEYRHRKPEDRHAHGERYSMNFAKVECGNDHVRNLYHEITLRNDWELEYTENEKARINAEIDALNEWLVWS